MRRSNNYDDDYKTNYYSGDASRSTIDEYLERVTMLQRMPSLASEIPPEVPIHYQQKDHPRPLRTIHDQNRARARAPDKHKKVHIAEHEEVIQIGRDGRRQVYEEDKTIDVEADGFIQQKHRNFDLSKWDTMKAY